MVVKSHDKDASKVPSFSFLRWKLGPIWNQSIQNHGFIILQFTIAMTKILWFYNTSPKPWYYWIQRHVWCSLEIGSEAAGLMLLGVTGTKTLESAVRGGTAR